MAKNKHLLHSIHHLIVGLGLGLKGITKISHHPVIGGVILLFGAIIIFYFLYLQLKKQANAKLNDLVHVFEALASLFTAYVFFKEGATYLPYVFLLASIGFFIAIYVSHKWKKRNNLIPAKQTEN